MPNKKLKLTNSIANKIIRYICIQDDLDSLYNTLKSNTLVGRDSFIELYYIKHKLLKKQMYRIGFSTTKTNNLYFTENGAYLDLPNHINICIKDNKINLAHTKTN